MAERNKQRGLRGLFWVLIVGLGFFATGCGAKAVVLKPTQAVKQTFEKVDMNPADYAFFTTGPETAPEAVLLIGNAHLGDFDSNGWKLRDKNTIVDLLKKANQKVSYAKKYGYPVIDDKGTRRGMLFTTFQHGKVYIDEEEGTFSVATPAMMDTGRGTYKRTSCSISICN